MLYFLCTSVFHIVTTLFILQTKYRGSTCEKILLLLDHVDNLVRIEEGLKSSGIFAKIIFIHTDRQDWDTIKSQLDAVPFESGGCFHLFGWECCGMFLAQKWEKAGRLILVEEGVYALLNLQKKIDAYNQANAHCRIDRALFHEVWKLAEGGTLQEKDIACEDLHMDTALKNEALQKELCDKLSVIFHKSDLSKSELADYDAVLFDTYYWGVAAGMPQEEEEFFLREITDCLKGHTVIIKPHPGERNYAKYKNVKHPVVKDPELPFEIYRFFGAGKKQMFVSVMLTCALIHEQVLFGGQNTVIVYLNRIYERYHVLLHKDENLALMEQMIQKNSAGSVFFPETFAELRQITARFFKGDIRNEDLENKDLENKDLENEDLENEDLENEDLENEDLENEAEKWLDWYSRKYHAAARSLKETKEQLLRERGQLQAELADERSRLTEEFVKERSRLTEEFVKERSRLTEEFVQERGRLMQALLREREQLHAAIDERDLLLKDVIGQREQLTQTLVEERIQFGRQIDELQKECQKSVLKRLIEKCRK